MFSKDYPTSIQPYTPTISTKDAPDATSPQVSSMALSRGWISCWAAHASMAFGSDTTTKRSLDRRIRGVFHGKCSTWGERYVEVWYVLIWYHVIWFLMIWYNMMWYDMMLFVHFLQQYCRAHSYSIVAWEPGYPAVGAHRRPFHSKQETAHFISIDTITFCPKGSRLGDFNSETMKTQFRNPLNMRNFVTVQMPKKQQNIFEPLNALYF